MGCLLRPAGSSRGDLNERIGPSGQPRQRLAAVGHVNAMPRGRVSTIGIAVARHTAAVMRQLCRDGCIATQDGPALRRGGIGLSANGSQLRGGMRDIISVTCLLVGN